MAQIMSRYSPVFVMVLPMMATLLIGCGGGTAALKPVSGGNGGVSAGQLSVSVPTINFGSVPVGSTATQTGKLTAATSTVTITSGSLTGQGYSVSGLSYPITLAAGQSISFTITFAPQASGMASGGLSFISNASNSPTAEGLTGAGTQAELHSVALSWDPSSSQVIGYNVYRGTTSGGPYPLKLTSSLQPTTSLVDNTVAGGTTYYYVATSVDQNSVESIYSNQITATVP
jgi:Abnormal spindle-like microcephaly-assoc'd, ASPM-SPD-2-Hydin